MVTPTLFQELTRMVVACPKWCLALGLFVGLVVAAPTASGVFSKTSFTLPFAATIIITVIIWFSTEYVLTMAMVERRISFSGCAKFVAPSILLLLPLVLALGSAWILPKLINKPAAGIILVMLVVFGVLALLLLRAWPVAQAVSSNLISPIDIFKSTAGQRVALFWVPGILTSINKLAPEYTHARNQFDTILIFIANGAVDGIFIVGLSAVTAAAWILSCRQDQRLIGNEA